MVYFSTLFQRVPALPNFPSVRFSLYHNWQPLTDKISSASQHAKEYCVSISTSIIHRVQGMWEKCLSSFQGSAASLSSNWSSLTGRISLAGQRTQSYCGGICGSVLEKVQSIQGKVLSYFPVSAAHARELNNQLSTCQKEMIQLQAKLKNLESALETLKENSELSGIWGCMNQDRRCVTFNNIALTPILEKSYEDDYSEVTENELSDCKKRVDQLQKELLSSQEEVARLSAALAEVGVLELISQQKLSTLPASTEGLELTEIEQGERILAEVGELLDQVLQRRGP